MRLPVLVTVLFVCNANVCRSPTAAAMLRRRLKDGERDDLVVVESAGTDADEGAAWCPTAMKHVGTETIEEFELTDRTSVLLDPKMLDEATLVLAADAESNAKVLRLQPHVRSRLFTVIEAAELADFVIGRSKHAADLPMLDHTSAKSPGTADDEEGLHWLIAEMNAARGQLPMPAPRRGRFGRNHPAAAFGARDVPDAHLSGTKVNHAKTFAILSESVDTLAKAFLTTAPEPSIVAEKSSD
jgi:protein-tyrosine phosphatase